MSDPEHRQRILETLTRWLDESAAEVERGQPSAPSDESNEHNEQAGGLFHLIEAFTSLRHDVKLQAKSNRNLQEELVQQLKDLGSTMDAVHRRVETPPPGMDSAKSLAEALVDVFDGLDRFAIQFDKSRRRFVDEIDDFVQESLDDCVNGVGWIARSFLRRQIPSLRERLRENLLERESAIWDAVAQGLDFLLSRVKRALAREQIEPIACIDLPVDPHLMTVVDLVESEELEPGVVVDEVRRGFLWKGRVLRFAEVRASTRRNAQESFAPESSHAPVETF